MGITIHYNGQLKPDASLSDLIFDVQRSLFCAPGWGMQVFSSDFDEEPDDELPIYGLVVFTHRCESLYLTFDRERRLISFDFGNRRDEPKFVSYPGAFTKTAFAGPHVHMKLVDLLRLLSEKYFSSFGIIDEAGYWENRDPEALMREFGYDDTVVAMLEQKLKAL